MPPIEKAAIAAGVLWLAMMALIAWRRPKGVSVFVAVAGTLLLAVFTIPVWKIFFDSGVMGLFIFAVLVWLLIGLYRKYLG